jgi:hypothetical protein
MALATTFLGKFVLFMVDFSPASINIAAGLINSKWT